MIATRNPLLVGIGLLTAVVPSSCLFVSVNIYFFVPIVVGLACVVVGCLKMAGAAKRTVTALGLVLCLTSAIGPFALAAYANRSGSQSGSSSLRAIEGSSRSSRTAARGKT